MTDWIPLPPEISAEDISGLRTRLRQKWREYFRDAGFAVRTNPLPVSIRRIESRPRLFRIVPLQKPDGEIKSDIPDLLKRDTLGDFDRDRILQELGDDPALKRSPESWTDTQKYMLVGDAEQVVRELAEKDPRIELHRLVTTSAYTKRLMVLGILSDLASGIEPKQLKLGSESDHGFLIRGLIDAGPGNLVGPLVAARNQPLAVIFSTRTGAQVAMVPRRGAFTRPSLLRRLPLGFGDFSLMGPGAAVYDTTADEVIGDGAARDALRLSVRAVEETVLFLTDPGSFTTGEGVFEPDQFWVSWTNYLAGTSALSSIAEHWQDRDEGMWGAFRALGILHGQWLGKRPQNELPFSHVLAPDRLEQNVLPCLPQGALADWGVVVARSYRRMLTAAFPGASDAESARQLGEVRNSLHGVGATPNRKRAFTERLRVVRLLDRRSRPSLHTVMDVASLWWLAASLSPSSHLRLGSAPWE